MVKCYFCGLVLEVPEGVYEPREDSKLLAESLRLRRTDRVLDVGTGSGALALFAAQRAARADGVDVNGRAVLAASKNALANKVHNVTFFESDLFERVTRTYDVVLFNAPYLPVTGEKPIWAGGTNGRVLLERFGKGLKRVLMPSGFALVLISSATGLEETRALFGDLGFSVGIAAQQKVPWETLYCLRLEPARSYTHQ